jgi:hypothetical protein
MATPCVHAFGIGCKILAGKRTEERAIMAFVVKKKPASELPVDLAEYGPSLAQLGRLNYTQALDVLSTTQMD